MRPASLLENRRRGHELLVPLAALAAALLLVVVHVFAAKLRFLHGIPRSRWLSAAGGVSVAYVFVHLLPELVEAQEAVTAAAEGVLARLERHVYVVALLGLAVFYGLELAARESRRGSLERGHQETSGAVFWVHVASYATYNGLIGYVLVRTAEEGVQTLALFALAIGLHFVVNDYGLREHHQERYSRIGRWILAAGVLSGWAVGLVAHVSDEALGLLLAFLAGGIVLNVLKEELPEERESRFSAFALGAASYTALLLAV